MIELVRALSADPDLQILDEVPQSLSHDNREVIYKLIQKFKGEGRAVILISHDLEETLKITDTISILRGRELIDTVVSSEISEDDLKRKMVGREMNEEYYRVDMGEQYGDQVILSLKNVSSATGVSDVSAHCPIRGHPGRPAPDDLLCAFRIVCMDCGRNPDVPGGRQQPNPLQYILTTYRKSIRWACPPTVLWMWRRKRGTYLSFLCCGPSHSRQSASCGKCMNPLPPAAEKENSSDL